MATVSTQIRLPEELHTRLSSLADRQYRSLNSLLIYLLADATDREEAREREREAARQEPDR